MAGTIEPSAGSVISMHGKMLVQKMNCAFDRTFFPFKTFQYLQIKYKLLDWRKIKDSIVLHK